MHARSTGADAAWEIYEVLSVSPEHPAVFLLLRQVQCECLLLSGARDCIPPTVLDQLSAAVMANPTSVSAWHEEVWCAEETRDYSRLLLLMPCETTSSGLVLSQRRVAKRPSVRGRGRGRCSVTRAADDFE
ncbi:tetratricopeptide repeat protein 37 [Clarias magur]|uniref:Tetratricopeptide repeat protein 37 n=1 Tax=Clarias magur TaxID=1594786 RepID=A0A8J4X0W3_CLAMG|nr:tetratricopeptide repeat protein 37 [Clarias magur]